MDDKKPVGSDMTKWWHDLFKGGSMEGSALDRYGVFIPWIALVVLLVAAAFFGARGCGG